MFSPLSDPADSTSSSVPLLPVDFVHLHFEEIEEYLSNSVSFL